MPEIPFTIKRLIAAAVLLGAFVVMASVFSPDRTRADEVVGPSISDPRAEKANDEEEMSTDPHESLRSLGSLESNAYSVHIYSTQVGPRYSVYDKVKGTLLGTLLSVQQVNQMFPEIQLPSSDFSAQDSETGPLMLVDPSDNGIRD